MRNAHTGEIDPSRTVAYSQNLEMEGLIIALHYVESSVVGGVEVLATDRHVQIASFMRKQRQHISHQFDVWHMSKSIMKRLGKIADTKQGSELRQWIPAINNHMWWSAAEKCHGAPRKMEIYTASH